jgi:hypothetical protein
MHHYQELPWRYNGRRWIRDRYGKNVLYVPKDTSWKDAICATASPEMLLALRNLVTVLAVTTQVDDVRVQAGIRRAQAAITAAERNAP